MPDEAVRAARACVFDAYGTLFDVHSAVGAHADALGPDAGAISTLWRQKQLEYTWLRSLMGAHVDFWHVTSDALDLALERHRIDDRALRDRLLAAYLELTPYPEGRHVLETLTACGTKLAILSNGTPDMLAAAVGNAGFATLFDAVLSVEALAIYKPDARVYQLACDALDVERDEVWFMSSNAWDAHGAAHFGFRVAWVNRFAQPPERLPGKPDAELTTLADLPALMGLR